MSEDPGARAQYQVEVMMAAKDGKSIEYTSDKGKTWKPVVEPKWNWARYDYRVAQEESDAFEQLAEKVADKVVERLGLIQAQSQDPKKEEKKAPETDPT